MAKNPGRDAWANGGKGKVAGQPRGQQLRVTKGLGPNKASGHKGGISRQGSKRG